MTQEDIFIIKIIQRKIKHLEEKYMDTLQMPRSNELLKYVDYNFKKRETLIHYVDTILNNKKNV